MFIGISGNMGAGKTTFAEMLREELNNYHLKARILPFAKPLKDIAIELGWNGQKDEKGRKLLQLLGTDVGRECINEDIWVTKWLTEATKLQIEEDVDIIISDDTRFINEATAIKESRGFLIEVYGRKYETNIGILDHASERGIQTTELITQSIDNSGTLGDLMAVAEALARKISDSQEDTKSFDGKELA